jgi:hypothetical protein
MKFKQTYSAQTTVQLAVDEIKTAFQDIDVSVLLYFASPTFTPDELAAYFQSSFPKAGVLGCTSSGEIVSGKMLDNAIVAMAFSSEIVADFEIQVLQNIKTEAKKFVATAFNAFEKHFEEPTSSMDYQKYLGILLIDALSNSEEKINDAIGNLTSVSFVGGSAGDNLQFKQTNVYANGKAYTDAAIVALLKVKTPFSVLKTQSMDVLPQVFKVTKANEEERRIIELDGRPATHVYAEALNVKLVDLADNLFKHPLGLVFDETDPFVRSPKGIEGTDVLFLCSVKEGQHLHLLTSRDIVKETQAALAKKKEELGQISAIVNFNCVLRTIELKQKNQTDAYGALFKDFPTIGFSTFGESFIGNLNQTATMIVFQ